MHSLSERPIDHLVKPYDNKEAAYMAANEEVNDVVVSGSKERETKNQVRFATDWGIIYIPKTALAKIGNPDDIEITVQPKV